MVYMYHSFLNHSSADGHLGCFHVLAIVNSAAINIGVHVSLSDLVSLVCMPRSGIAGSYGSNISRFLRNLHTVLHSNAVYLNFRKKCSLPDDNLSNFFVLLASFLFKHLFPKSFSSKFCNIALHLWFYKIPLAQSLE